MLFNERLATNYISFLLFYNKIVFIFPLRMNDLFFSFLVEYILFYIPVF